MAVNAPLDISNRLLLHADDSGDVLFKVQDSVFVNQEIQFQASGAAGSSDVIIDQRFSNSVLVHNGAFSNPNMGILRSDTSSKYYVGASNNISADTNLEYRTIILSSADTLNSSLSLPSGLENFVMPSGASLNLGTYVLEVPNGDLLVNGELFGGSGSILFNSTDSVAQQLAGLGEISIGRLRVATNPSGGLTNLATDTLDITQGLELDSGTFITGGKCRLYSDASGTAYLGEIGSGASISGALIYRLYVDGVKGDADWRYLNCPAPGWEWKYEL